MNTIIKYSISPYLKSIGLSPFSCSAGIDLGDVWIERVGIKGENQFTLVGHAVNIASQLQEIATSNQILIGNYVHHNLSDEEKGLCKKMTPPQSWTWVLGETDKPYPFFSYNGHWEDYPLTL